jgi:hypothetical protein
MSEPKPNYINPECFGDDVANWMAEQLRAKGCVVDEPGQEDFGWYCNFRVADTAYCFVVGHRADDLIAPGEWIGWVERNPGFMSSLFGGRARGVALGAVQLIDEILSSSPDISEVRWHHKRDFDAGREDQGTSQS